MARGKRERASSDKGLPPEHRRSLLLFAGALPIAAFVLWGSTGPNSITPKLTTTTSWPVGAEEAVELTLPTADSEELEEMVHAFQEAEMSPSRDEALGRLMRADLLLRMDKAFASRNEQGRAVAGCKLVRLVIAEPEELDAELHQLAQSYSMQCDKLLPMFERQAARLAAGVSGRVRSISREAADSFPYSRFYEEYHSMAAPVLVTGMREAMLPFEAHRPWDLPGILEACGPGTVVPLRRGKSVEGAETRLTLKEFLATFGKPSVEAPPLYLFDWSLPRHCPALLEGLVVPSYFSSDMLQRLPQELKITQAWPSLLVGTTGSGSALHVDSGHTHFYLLLLQGRKRWRVYSTDDIEALYPNPFTDSFVVTGFASPNITRFPLLETTEPWEFIQEPGELVLLPGGCPHQVDNLEPSVALAGNYVDSINWQA